MEKRAFKNDIYSVIASMAKSFSNANRLEVLDLLANGEKTVEQIAVQTAISVANASQHLQMLKKARLVKSRRDGNYILYALQSQQVYAAWKALRELALHCEPETRVILETYRKSLDNSGDPTGISWKNIPDFSKIWLIDVRPHDEFANGHLPGAHSAPIDELPQCLESFPRDKTIIACCRGPFCTYADEAVQLLRAHGFKALRLEESYLDIQLENN